LKSSYSCAIIGNVSEYGKIEVDREKRILGEYPMGKISYWGDLYLPEFNTETMTARFIIFSSVG
jgi:hypothetical protein